MRTVRTVERALALLRTIAVSPDPMTFGELHRVSQLPKASAHNLLATLEECGYVVRDQNGRYRVGLTAFEVGSAYPVRTGLLRLAEPILRDLVRRHNETCHLAILDHGDVLYLERLESSQPVRLTTASGVRVTAYATGIGKALLSLLSDQEVRAMYPGRLRTLTPATVSSMPALLRDLGETRRRGYSIDNEESTAGVRCAGAAIDAPGWPAAGISLSVPLQRMPDERLAELGADVQAAAAALGERLREVKTSM
ncbi:IclR family transcriptional regulator [Actinoplanes sp. M2I2]|uniref:IclR family transcriptional regulator n=1 Tax=Actinoplanes sp. M2I2 TaxID=1734444 RepID=UPI0020207608|nr:IclR family transcriptional regulator [Actinoplanes sp. M2I2]